MDTIGSINFARAMKLNSLDLNLLLVFDAVLRMRSVTRAAEEVGLTQASLSNALTRLRAYFNDPLFVRMKGEMHPTPFAQGLAEPVHLALRQLQQALEGKRHFDAQAAERSFRICMTEIAQRVFLPRLMQHFASAAPRISLVTVDMAPDRAQMALAVGEIDLAIGYFADFGDNYFCQRLFEEHYVALVRTGHSSIGDTLTLEGYLQASHISYQPAAASHELLDVWLDREFARHGARRRVGLTVAHSMGLSSIVETTDLVLTVPSRLAQTFTALSGLRVMPLPLAVPAIDIRQHWHLRYHHDPGNQWLRAQFMGLFQR